MSTDNSSPTNIGEITEQPLNKDPITGRFLPGNRLSPGKPKGAVHSRTVFENFLEARYMQKKKMTVKVRAKRKNLETGHMEEVLIDQDTEEEYYVESELTNEEVLLQAMFDRAVKNGGIEGIYMFDQKWGKAVQQMLIQHGQPVRGFELPPDQEKVVDDTFSLYEKETLPAKTTDNANSDTIVPKNPKNKKGNKKRTTAA